MKDPLFHTHYTHTHTHATTLPCFGRLDTLYYNSCALWFYKLAQLMSPYLQFSSIERSIGFIINRHHRHTHNYGGSYRIRILSDVLALVLFYFTCFTFVCPCLFVWLRLFFFCVSLTFLLWKMGYFWWSNIEFIPSITHSILYAFRFDSISRSLWQCATTPFDYYFDFQIHLSFVMMGQYILQCDGCWLFFL